MFEVKGAWTAPWVLVPLSAVRGRSPALPFILRHCEGRENYWRLQMGILAEKIIFIDIYGKGEVASQRLPLDR